MRFGSTDLTVCPAHWKTARQDFDRLRHRSCRSVLANRLRVSARLAANDDDRALGEESAEAVGGRDRQLVPAFGEFGGEIEAGAELAGDVRVPADFLRLDGAESDACPPAR